MNISIVLLCIVCNLQTTKFLLTGTSWSQVQSTARVEQLLGWTGLIVQVLWGDLCGSIPCSHPPWPRHSVAVQASDEASRDERSDVSFAQITWSGQGSWLQQDNRWLTACLLETPQHCGNASQAIEIDTGWLHCCKTLMYWHTICCHYAWDCHMLIKAICCKLSILFCF